MNKIKYAVAVVLFVFFVNYSKAEDRIEKNKSKIFTIHHFAGSWLPDEEIKRRRSFRYKAWLKAVNIVRHIIIAILGKERFEKMRGRTG